MSAFHGLLSVLIWLPIIGMLVGTDERAKCTLTFAFIIAIITLLLCVPLIWFDPNIKQAYGKICCKSW